MSRNPQRLEESVVATSVLRNRSEYSPEYAENMRSYGLILKVVSYNADEGNYTLES